MRTTEQVIAEHAAVFSLVSSRAQLGSRQSDKVKLCECMQDMLLFKGRGSWDRDMTSPAFTATWAAMSAGVDSLEARFEELERELWLTRRLEMWLDQQVIEICIASVAY